MQGRTLPASIRFERNSRSVVATCADTWAMSLPPRSETLISFATLVNPTTAALPPSVRAPLRSPTDTVPDRCRG